MRKDKNIWLLLHETIDEIALTGLPKPGDEVIVEYEANKNPVLATVRKAPLRQKRVYQLYESIEAGPTLLFTAL